MPGINTLRFQMVCCVGIHYSFHNTGILLQIADDAVAVSCSLYLWKWSDKIIVSDIDGTITKYDMHMHWQK